MSCAGPGEESDSFQMAHHLPNHLLIIVGVLRETNPILYIGEICCYPTSHLPLGVTNEGREAIITSTPSSKFLAPLLGIPSAKIGELHTIFFLCFCLVLLVYLSVFILVSSVTNYKKIICHTCCYYGFH